MFSVHAVRCNADGIMLVFCRKSHLVLEKSTKKLLQPDLLFLVQIYTKSFAGFASLQTLTGEPTRLPTTLYYIRVNF